jgi:hypothetical protein
MSFHIEGFIGLKPIKNSKSFHTSLFINIYHHIQKSLKIPKGQSESYTSIEEEQITQWPKEKVQKDKKRSTKYTHKTKNQVIRTPRISLI